MLEPKFIIENRSRTFLTVQLNTDTIQLRVGEVSKPYPESEITPALKNNKDIRIRLVHTSVADGKQPGDSKKTGKVEIKK